MPRKHCHSLWKERKRFPTSALQRLSQVLVACTQEPFAIARKSGGNPASISRTHVPTRNRTHLSSRERHYPCPAKKNADRIEEHGLPTLPAPTDDVMEVDEICVQKSPGLWLWIAISRKIGQVLGFALGDRSDETLRWMWTDVPASYVDVPVCTDHLQAYERFFASGKHTACDKGSGKTSIVEAYNTKWRQRQSGLVRRSCGVWQGIETDIAERFMILLEQHNKEKIRQWERRGTAASSP